MPDSSRLPGLKLRTRDYELGSASLYSEGHVRPKERRAIIQSQIERELQRLKEKDSQWDDLIDVGAIYSLSKASLTRFLRTLIKTCPSRTIRACSNTYLHRRRDLLQLTRVSVGHPNHVLCVCGSGAAAVFSWIDATPTCDR
jgi:hypothetical protein